LTALYNWKLGLNFFWLQNVYNDSSYTLYYTSSITLSHCYCPLGLSHFVFIHADLSSRYKFIIYTLSLFYFY
jgi:hypothetical protein